MSNRDRFLFGLENLPWLEGYQDIVCHADAWGFAFVDPVSGRTVQEVSAEELAFLIRDSGKYSGGPIRLIACSSGAEASGVAQQLANILNVPVYAPVGDVYNDGFGKIRIAPDDDAARQKFKEFSGSWDPENWIIYMPKEE